jgi:hypothetical protein
MTTQIKMMDTNLKPWLDMILVALSVFVGGLITLLGLWLWFDYQTDPTRSLWLFLAPTWRPSCLCRCDKVWTARRS